MDLSMIGFCKPPRNLPTILTSAGTECDWTSGLMEAPESRSSQLHHN